MKNLLIFLLFLIGPIFYTQANIIVTNGLTHQFKTEKGNIYKGKIEVKNIGKTSKNVKLYLQDMTYTSEGTTNYTSPGSNKRSNSSWLKFNTDYLVLEAGQNIDIYYELSIPENVSEEGTYWTTCMIEPVEDINPNQSGGIQINSIVRYAIQIIADYYTQPLSPKLLFEKINLDKNNNQKTVEISLANEGKLYCKSKIALEIYKKNDGTKQEGDFYSQTLSLLPSTSKKFSIDISKLSEGSFKIVAFAKDDKDNVFAIEFDLDI